MLVQYVYFAFSPPGWEDIAANLCSSRVGEHARSERRAAGRRQRGREAAAGAQAGLASPRGYAGTQQQKAPRPPPGLNRDSIGTIWLSAQIGSLVLDGKHHMVK